MISTRMPTPAIEIAMWEPAEMVFVNSTSIKASALLIALLLPFVEMVFVTLMNFLAAVQLIALLVDAITTFVKIQNILAPAQRIATLPLPVEIASAIYTNRSVFVQEIVPLAPVEMGFVETTNIQEYAHRTASSRLPRAETGFVNPQKISSLAPATVATCLAVIAFVIIVSSLEHVRKTALLLQIVVTPFVI